MFMCVTYFAHTYNLYCPPNPSPPKTTSPSSIPSQSASSFQPNSLHYAFTSTVTSGFCT